MRLPANGGYSRGGAVARPPAFQAGTLGSPRGSASCEVSPPPRAASQPSTVLAVAGPTAGGRERDTAEKGADATEAVMGTLEGGGGQGVATVWAVACYRRWPNACGELGERHEHVAGASPALQQTCSPSRPWQAQEKACGGRARVGRAPRGNHAKSSASQSARSPRLPCRHPRPPPPCALEPPSRRRPSSHERMTGRRASPSGP